jgi:hypothetical protein
MFKFKRKAMRQKVQAKKISKKELEDIAYLAARDACDRVKPYKKGEQVEVIVTFITKDEVVQENYFNNL